MEEVQYAMSRHSVKVFSALWRGSVGLLLLKSCLYKIDYHITCSLCPSVIDDNVDGFCDGGVTVIGGNQLRKLR